MNAAEQWRRNNSFALQGIAASAAKLHSVHIQANIIAKVVEDWHKRHEFTLKMAIGQMSSIISTSALARSAALASLKPYHEFAIEAARISEAQIRIQKTAEITQRTLVTPKRRLIEMAESYQRLQDKLRLDLQVFLSAPSIVVKQPSVEMYLATRQAEISTTEADIFDEGEELLKEVDPGAKQMREILASVDKALVPLYEGAIEALESKNTDRVRHFSVSSRELLREVLHRLAPNESFFEWNREDLYVHQGKPTRRGRLMYICRNIMCGEFATFIEKDIRAAVEFLSLFEKGTHEIESQYNKRQLRVLRIRMEYMIEFLVKTSREV